MTTRTALTLLLVVVVTAPVAGGVPTDDGDTTVSDEVLVVGDDGPYTTIQAAVDAADDGDIVRVTPGTYRERVTLGKNVTVIAPRGATLNGTRFEDCPAFHVEEGVAPIVAGFTVVDYPMGVEAFSASGDWVVRNTTFVRAETVAVDATGDWILRNVTVRDTGTAIEAGDSTGDWPYQRIRRHRVWHAPAHPRAPTVLRDRPDERDHSSGGRRQ